MGERLTRTESESNSGEIVFEDGVAPAAYL